jgi:hypothetical protein
MTQNPVSIQILCLNIAKVVVDVVRERRKRRIVIVHSSILVNLLVPRNCSATLEAFYGPNRLAYGHLYRGVNFRFVPAYSDNMLYSKPFPFSA